MYNHYSDDFIKRDMRNPIRQDETCKLISNRKKKYYTYRYNPSKIIANIDKDQLKILDNICDLKDDNITKRCNCISITLYYLDDSIDRNILIYCYSMYKTVENVRKNLPNYLVRIYLDATVWKYIDTHRKYSTEAGITMNYIMYSENVEIYTFLCKSFSDVDYRYAQNRTFRFLTLLDTIELDPDEEQYGVNLAIIREADGVVSNLDCLNIIAFEKSKKIFYQPEFLFKDENDIRYNFYQYWGIFYKLLNKKFYSRYNNPTDLMAGLFSFSLKIKKDYYYQTASDLRQKIKLENISDCEINDILNSNVVLHRNYKIIENYDINDKVLYPLNSREEILSYITTGYDEILLMRIFEKLLSVKIISLNLSDYIFDRKLLKKLYHSNSEFSEYISIDPKDLIKENIIYEPDQLKKYKNIFLKDKQFIGIENILIYKHQRTSPIKEDERKSLLFFPSIDKEDNEEKEEPSLLFFPSINKEEEEEEDDFFEPFDIIEIKEKEKEKEKVERIYSDEERYVYRPFSSTNKSDYEVILHFLNNWYYKDEWKNKDIKILKNINLYLHDMLFDPLYIKSIKFFPLVYHTGTMYFKDKIVAGDYLSTILNTPYYFSSRTADITEIDSDFKNVSILFNEFKKLLRKHLGSN